MVAQGYHLIHFDSPLDRFIVPLNFDHFLSKQNLGFIFIYLLLLAGGMMVASANSETRMIRDALVRRRNRLLDRAVDGYPAPPQQYDESDFNLPDLKPPAWAKHLYIMYLAPLIVMVVGAVIVHWLGLG